MSNFTVIEDLAFWNSLLSDSIYNKIPRQLKPECLFVERTRSLDKFGDIVFVSVKYSDDLHFVVNADVAGGFDPSGISRLSKELSEIIVKEFQRRASLCLGTVYGGDYEI